MAKKSKLVTCICLHPRLRHGDKILGKGDPLTIERELFEEFEGLYFEHSEDIPDKKEKVEPVEEPVAEEPVEEEE